MRWHLALSAWLAAAPGWVRADPTVPQINPLHGEREDAQRIGEQQRGLAGEPMAPAPAPVEPKPAPAGDGRRAFGPGVLLIELAGVSALVTLPLVVFDSPARSDATLVLLGTTVVTGAVGIALVVSNRPVQVAPTVTSRAVGLSISGRM